MLANKNLRWSIDTLADKNLSWSTNGLANKNLRWSIDTFANKCTNQIHKQPPEVFFKKRCSKNF